VERGAIRLIGATTENPSFELNAALLSRCRVYTLQPLTEAQIIGLLQRALADESRGLGGALIAADEEALATIAAYASGDARNALNALDVAANLAAEQPDRRITKAIAAEALQRRVLLYDKRASSTTTLSPRCTRACATPTPTPRCTGWVECCRRAKIRCT